jgi:hypothetical protein
MVNLVLFFAVSPNNSNEGAWCKGLLGSTGC